MPSGRGAAYQALGTLNNIFTVGSAAVSMLIFSGSVSTLRLLNIVLILFGIVGLKWTSAGATN